MEKELDDARAIGVEVLFQVDNGTIPVKPECIHVAWLVRNFAAGGPAWIETTRLSR